MKIYNLDGSDNEAEEKPSFNEGRPIGKATPWWRILVSLGGVGSGIGITLVHKRHFQINSRISLRTFLPQTDLSGDDATEAINLVYKRLTPLEKTQQQSGLNDHSFITTF